LVSLRAAMAKFDKWLTDASADDRVSAAARRALRDRLKAVRHYLAAAKGATSREQEPVHQMRVWSRRASAALRMFRDLLPRRQSRKMQRVLRKIRQLGGDARDCDLLLLSLADEHTTSETVRIARLLKQRRKAAQKPIDRLHRKLVVRGKLKRRTKKLVRSIRWKGKARSEPNFRDWAAEQLSELMQAVFSFDSAMLQSDDQLHQLRIAGKRLRYAAEL
jgi:CHAD domain-containing protein